MMPFSGDPANLPATAPALDSYKDLEYLIIDDSPPARQSLKLCMQAVGGLRVFTVQSYMEAATRIRRVMPDVIICDYILGSGRTGQQLLEDLRRNDALPERVVFIMVTAERTYEKVVSAVELAPDDYIIKPFSPEILHLRLDRVIQRKLAFRDYYKAKVEREFELAIYTLRALQYGPPGKAYRFEILRYIATTLLEAAQVDEAIEEYQTILQIHPFPWASLGLAKAYRMKNRHADARETVEGVIRESPNFFEAYDLKAGICSDMGDYAEAQGILEQACARTPGNWTRKRNLAVAATRNGDFESAMKAMVEVVENNAGSAADRLELARTAIENGALDEARAAMQGLGPKELAGLPASEAMGIECVRAILDEVNGEKKFNSLRHQIATTTTNPTAVDLDALRAALHFEDLELADKVAERLLSGHDAKHSFKVMLAIYQKHERAPHFKNLQKRVATSLIKGRAADN